jgi:hypothetical protein
MVARHRVRRTAGRMMKIEIRMRCQIKKEKQLNAKRHSEEPGYFNSNLTTFST